MLSSAYVIPANRVFIYRDEKAFLHLSLTDTMAVVFKDNTGELSAPVSVIYIPTFVHFPCRFS